jgi:DNA-binding response OmpR family regulator
LLVDDDPLLLASLERTFVRRGYAVASAATVAEAGTRLSSERFDAAILDRVLPDGDAAALCQARRESGDATPFILFSGLGTEQDILEGYEASVDLYLRKPMSPEELSAHIMALLKRRPASHLSAGPLTIDVPGGELQFPSGERQRLARQEISFLVGLTTHASQTITRDELVTLVWGTEEPDSNGLDVIASRIRKKLGGYSWMLQTVRGRGFRLRTEPLE